MRSTRTFLRHAVGTIAAFATGSSLAWAQVTEPDRPAKPLFRGQQGEQRSSEIAYEPTSRTVTLKLSVQDLNRFFIPNLRRNNFAVFEDGTPQHNITVEVEHAPITLAVLMEMGGRSQQLNNTLASDSPYIARPVLDVLGRDDKLAVFTYDDRLHQLVGFDAPHDKWDAAFSAIPRPQCSEANFYDAAIQVLDRLASVSGRKAMLVIATGIDTFSHATFDDLLKKAEAAHTPVYVMGLADTVRKGVIDRSSGPLARVDWNACERQLERLARASGGRAYADVNPIGSLIQRVRTKRRHRHERTFVANQC